MTDWTYTLAGSGKKVTVKNAGYRILNGGALSLFEAGSEKVIVVLAPNYWLSLVPAGTEGAA